MLVMVVDTGKKGVVVKSVQVKLHEFAPHVRMAHGRICTSSSVLVRPKNGFE